jgi:hypothetical protein
MTAEMYPSPVCGNSTYPLPSGNAIRCGMPSMMPQSCGRNAAVAGALADSEHWLVTYFWQPDDVCAAVRSRFDWVNWDSRGAYRPQKVAVDGGDLLVTFRYEGYTELFGVRFSLDNMPQGPCTGDVCESLDDWAEEVDWTLDEELNTRMVQTAKRSVSAEGLVMLRWRNASGTR